MGVGNNSSAFSKPGQDQREQPIHESEKKGRESPLWSSPRSSNQKEAPWLKDQRQAPRSVRTPPPYATANKSQRTMRYLPKATKNPFDSPAPSTGSRSNATLASRNPSPSDGNRMLYTPPPTGQSPSNTMHRPNNSKDKNEMNPFGSPASNKDTAAGRNPFESPAPVRKTISNPFDESPVSTRQTPNHNHQKQAPSNPFDASVSSDRTVPSPSYPQVRVTVTQQDGPPIRNKERDLQQGSVGLDSLEQILDVTEGTTTDGSTDIPNDVDEGEEWSDEPYLHHREQIDSHQRQKQQRMIYPNPSQSFPNTFASQQSFETSHDGTQTSGTPSDMALKAAQTLKKSFEYRRRQKVGMRNADLVLEYSQTEDSELLPGVAGRRRAEAEAKKSVAATDTAYARNPNVRLEPPTSQIAQNGDRVADVEEKLLHQNEEAVEDSDVDANYTLHDLCDEAISTDDLAWHNALYLLATQPNLACQIEPECKMTPLHVACLAQNPPPLWMTRGLLYASPETCQQPDTGGRLPLHLLVATTADIHTIRLLVEEYPPSVAHKDDRGFTPLQLLLKRNDPDGLTLEHMRLLLGQQTGSGQARKTRRNHFLFRRGDHLKPDLVLKNLEVLVEEMNQRHEITFREYPDDVRRALTKLCQWKRRQANKQGVKRNKEIQFLQSRETGFANPASIPTPTGQLLPLHLLVRRKIHSDTNAQSQELHGTKQATLVDLLRVLIAAYPQGLVGVDLNGKTPVMTALLQTDASPSEEVVELLLGLRTPGFDGRNGMKRPAMIATSDTSQMPLHVAAEERLSNQSLLSTICEVYPDARTMQDVRGRTPLHLAFQNYRSNPVDEHTMELLFVDAVAKIKDNDGKTPLDLLLDNPGCIIRNPSKNSRDDHRKIAGVVLQEFFDASVERPRNRLEAREFLEKFQKFPSWLRREACAARFVQDILVEEMSSPFTTFRILGSGIVLALLLVALRRMLHVDPDYTFLIYYLATYHLVMQVIHLGTAIYMGECFRLCVSNIWRWCDLATGILSLWCAIYVSQQIIDISDGAGMLISRLGASATIACWLSILGYFVEWSCGLAVFIGSAAQLVSVLLGPLCVAIMGFFATSQVLYTLEDCSNGGICNLSESYGIIYGTMLGQPVLTDIDYELSTGVYAIVLIFTVSCVWWVLSVIAMVVTEARRLDRRQLSLTWYWEPKVALTVMGSTGNKNEKISDAPSLVEQYCDVSEKFWHILASALRGEKSDVHWDVWCFRSTTLLFCAGSMALFILPIWFALGFFTLGLLWPPQIRRWLFCPGPSRNTMFNSFSRLSTLHDDDLARSKLSQLRAEIIDLKAAVNDQNYQIQKDLGVIKEVIFRAAMEEDASFE